MKSILLNGLTMFEQLNQKIEKLGTSNYLKRGQE